jgi:CheY-like chemotaxis protein
MTSSQWIVTSRQRDRGILVVDDDETMRQGLVELLSDEGYRVVTAENGADALVELRRLPRFVPGLILLDMTMPVMNGQQFYAEKQQDPALTAIPLVVMSADRHLRQNAAAFGGAYLEKPARRQDILDVVERYVCKDVSS